MFSCATTDDITPEPLEVQPVVEVVEPEPEIIVEPEVEGEQLKEDSSVTLSFEGEEVILDEPSIEVLTEDDKEYSRSVAETTDAITYDDFKSDKEAILAIIDELEKNKKAGDVDAWSKMLHKESLEYWNNKDNLKKISKLIPNNSSVLHSIDEYFEKVYLPAREGYEVTEIRYKSQTNVAAVEVEGKNDIVIYNFLKENGKWFLSIPKL